LNIFAKLGEDGLERGFEAEAFSRCEIGGVDDVLDFLVGDAVDVDVARQPAPESAIGVFDAALLPGGIGVAEPCRHVAHVSQQAVLGEDGVVVEGDGLAQGGVDPGEDGEHDGYGLGGSFPGKRGGEGET
jgi:hypothetical protein